METCKYLESCAFFNNPATQKFQILTDQLKVDYCHGRFADCARYQVASRLGPDKVPPTMLPTQLQWAEMIFRHQADAAFESGSEVK